LFKVGFESKEANFIITNITLLLHRDIL